MNQQQDQNQEQSVIAIADSREKALQGKWQFITYPNREETVKALDDARKQGKIAIFYENGFDELPPEF